MSNLFQLRTPGLLLRQWQEEDYPEFAALNADPEVMEFFPACLSRKESDHLAVRFKTQISEQGWGLWATELIETGQFIGFIGLGRNSDSPRGEVLEVGWRLAREFWGQGYATEGARAALVFAFQMLKTAEVYSLTSVTNVRSQAVMHRLGMTDTNENFMHPRVSQESSLREHVLFRIEAGNFQTDLPVEIVAA